MNPRTRRFLIGLRNLVLLYLCIAVLAVIMAHTLIPWLAGQ